MSKTIRIALALLLSVIGAALAYPAMTARGGVSLNLPVFWVGLFASVSGIILVFSPRLGGVLGSLALICLAGILIPPLLEATGPKARIGLVAWVAGLLFVAGTLHFLSIKRQSRN